MGGVHLAATTKAKEVFHVSDVAWNDLDPLPEKVTPLMVLSLHWGLLMVIKTP